MGINCEKAKTDLTILEKELIRLTTEEPAGFSSIIKGWTLVREMTGKMSEIKGYAFYQEGYDDQGACHPGVSEIWLGVTGNRFDTVVASRGHSLLETHFMGVRNVIRGAFIEKIEEGLRPKALAFFEEMNQVGREKGDFQRKYHQEGFDLGPLLNYSCNYISRVLESGAKQS